MKKGDKVKIKLLDSGTSVSRSGAPISSLYLSNSVGTVFGASRDFNSSYLVDFGGYR